MEKLYRHGPLSFPGPGVTGQGTGATPGVCHNKPYFNVNLLQRHLSREQLNAFCDQAGMEPITWRDFFGSSVELAPSLMTIYDNYASGTGTTTPTECNQNTLPPPGQPADHAAECALATPPPPLAYVKHDVENLTDVGSSSGAALRQSVNHESRLPYHAPGAESEMKGESGESDGPPAALGHNAIFCGFNGSGDASKKRPLSISSTSSATSSTSSLPRPQRKKVAGGFNGSPLVPNGHVTGNVEYVTGTAALGTSGVPPLPTSLSGTSAGSLGGNAASAADMEVSMEDDGEEFTGKTPSPTPTTSTSTTRQDSAASSGSGAVSYIDKVVAEILETERTYVHDLNEIIQGYLYELRSDPESRLDAADINALFGNIEDIYDFNKEFLEKLETCQEDAVRLAQCFVDQNEGFVIYSNYCTNYPGAVEVLTQVLGSPEKAEVIRRQQTHLDHNLPLGAYLLKPVQRILKYHLLLQNMLSHMEDGGADVVSAALASMTNMAAHINEMKRKHEHAVRYQEMQSLLYDWDGGDISTYGDLVLEDTFRMHGAKGDRHILLFQKGLLIAKHKDDTGLQIKDCIKCSNLMLVESIPREPLSFHVIPFDNPRGQYTFQARCLDQKRQWCLELKRLILESYTADKAIPSNVKDLVLTLTSRDERTAREHGGLTVHGPGTPKPCPAPDYLDRKKRTRRRSVTSVLPDFAHLKSQVTKKVLPKKGDVSSPKVSPRVRRRRSESAVPRENVAHINDKLKLIYKAMILPQSVKTMISEWFDEKRGLCEGEDFSDTDSAEPGLFHSLESLHSPTSTPSKTGEGADSARGRSRRTRHNTADAIDASSFTDGTCDEESGLESVDGTPTISPSALRWPDSTGRRRGQALRGAHSPSPLKRRESFRIATTLHPVDSRKPPEGRRHLLQRSPGSAESQPVKEKRTSRFLRSWRRVSEGDLNYMTKSVEEPRQVDTDECGYVIMKTGRPHISLTLDEDGDDEAEEEHLYSTVLNTQMGIRLLEDDDGDFTEVPLNLSAYSQGDTNNNPTTSPSLTGVAYEDQTDGTNNNRHLRPVAHQGHLISKGLRTGAGCAEHGQRSQSCSPCFRLAQDNNSLNVKSSPAGQRSPSPCMPRSASGSSSGRSPTPSPGGSKLDNLDADQIGLYDNIHYHWNNGSRDTSNLKSYLNGNREEQDLVNMNTKECTINSRSNPWVPQVEGHTKTDRKGRPRLRSNSLTSLTDHSVQEARALYSHRKLPSDTLVFINRNAFVSSGTHGMIRHDVDTERAIARLATPPRDFGPSDIIQQIKDSQERGRVVTRYATPPRTLSDSTSLSSNSTVIANCQSDESGGYVAVSPTGPSRAQGLRPRSHSTLPSDMRYAGPSMWNDLEDYMAMSPTEHSQGVPRFPNSASSTPDNGFYRQSSLNETGMHSLSSPSYANSLQSPPLSSPSSITSSESIVESLKHAVFSFTSRIASHLPRSTESSPRRTPRCRSISALEELRVETLQEEQKPPVRKKDRRGKFVAQLAKVYSEHVKRRGRSASVERSGSFKEKDSKLSRQLTTLLREHKPGSSLIGERMASSKPVVLGTYTLPRHRPPRPKKSPSSEDSVKEPPQTVSETGEIEESPEAVVRRRSQSQKPDTDSCHSSAYDSGCIDVGVKDLTLDGEQQQQQQQQQQHDPTLQATLDAFSLVCSGMDTDDDDSSIYYYERKFVEDLESNFGDDAFRDSAVYSDDGCAPTDPETASLNVSIKETKRLIEQRSRTRSLPRTEIRQEEKAKGIKDILRSLEMAAQARLESAGHDRPADTETAASEKAMLKSIRDRTRELEECAALTRIRQAACSVLEDMPSGDEEAPTEGAAGAASPPLRRGWVKQVVTLLQEHPEQLLSSSED